MPTRERNWLQWTRVFSSSVIAATACSSGDSEVQGDVPCTLALVGALTETLACQVIATSGAYVAGGTINFYNHDGDFSQQYDSPDGSIRVTANIGFTVSLRVGTYSDTSRGAASGVVSVTDSAGHVWSALDNPMPGSYSATVTTLANPVQRETSKYWTIHGTFDAVLPARAATGAVGSITMRIVY